MRNQLDVVIGLLLVSLCLDGLAALEIIEWPVAVIVAAGHLLADQRRSDTFHGFGEALEQASTPS